jgi:hypothetical protein
MDWKKIGLKLLFPPVWLVMILTVISAAALVTVFLSGWEQTIIAYIVYVLSFYTVSVVTCFLVIKLPKQYKQMKERIYKNPLGNRYMTDKVFRTEISLYLSLSISLIYVGANLLSWYLLRSWWFIVLAVYYVIMSVMRFLLVRYVRVNEIGTSLLGEWKRSRICAYILLLINLSLSGAVLMILYQSKGYDYPGVMIYVMALYTFYSTTHAIVDIVRFRSLGSPIMSTAKIVSLSAALVSMLNLETAMFAQFGAEMPQQYQNLMIMLTGAGISVTVVTLSVVLIVKATKEIRRAKHG